MNHKERLITGLTIFLLIINILAFGTAIIQNPVSILVFAGISYVIGLGLELLTDKPLETFKEKVSNL